MKFEIYHFHLYFSHEQIALATEIAQSVRDEFQVAIGRVWDRPVGPHPVNSCQISVPRAKFQDVVVWLMENRQGLDVFIHPEGEDDLIAHRDHVMWLGQSYELKLEIFK